MVLEMRGNSALKAHENARWAGMVASSWVQATVGVCYCFGLYSPMLKEFLGYNQAQLNTLGFAKDLGTYVAVFQGLAVDVIPVWGFLALGSIQSFVGYGVLWLVLSGRIAPPPYWMVCVLLAVGSNGGPWLDTVNIVVNLRNFPHKRGAVTGVLKCCFGLSSAIFSLLYAAILHSDSPASFLLLAASVITGVCFLAFPFIRPVTPAASPELELDDEDDDDDDDNFSSSSSSAASTNKFSFLWFYFVLFAFTLYLLAAALLTSLGFINTLATQVIACGMIFFLGAPLFLPTLIAKFSKRRYQNKTGVDAPAAREPFLLPRDQQCHSNCPHRVDVEDFPAQTKNHSKVAAPVVQILASVEEEEEAAAKAVRSLAEAVEEANNVEEEFAGHEPEMNLIQAVTKLEYWLLFLSFLIGSGTAVTAQNNLGQLGEAQGLNNVTVFVTLISTMSSLGRLGGGIISDYGVRLAAIPRPIWMAIAQAGLVFAHLLLATALPGSLYPASILTGISFGILWAVIVPTTSELFGLKHIGLLYSTITISSALGSFLFSSLVGPLFDRERQRETEMGKNTLWTYNSEPATIPTSSSEHSSAAAAAASFSSFLLEDSSSSSVRLLQQAATAAEGKCSGAHCFRLAFIIMAAVCAVGVFINLALAARTRSLYKSLHKHQNSNSTTTTTTTTCHHDCQSDLPSQS
jgi:MFS family permease